MKWSRRNKVSSEKDALKSRKKQRKYVSESVLDSVPEKISTNPKYMRAVYSSPRSGDLVTGQLLLSRPSRFTLVPQLLENKPLDKIKLVDFPDKEFPKKSSQLPCISFGTYLKNIIVSWWRTLRTCKCNFHLLFSKQYWVKTVSSLYKRMVICLRSITLLILRLKWWHRFVFFAAVLCVFLENIRLWFLPISSDPYVWVMVFFGVLVLALDLLLHFILIITNNGSILSEYSHHRKESLTHGTPVFSPQQDRSSLTSPPMRGTRLFRHTDSPTNSMLFSSPTPNKVLSPTSRLMSPTSDGNQTLDSAGGTITLNDAKKRSSHRPAHVHRFVFGSHKDYYRDLNTDDKREIALFFLFMDTIALLSIMLDLQCHHAWPKLSTQSSGWELISHHNDGGGGGWWCPVNGNQAQIGVPPIVRTFRLLRFTRLLRSVGNFGVLHYGNPQDASPSSEKVTVKDKIWECFYHCQDIICCKWSCFSCNFFISKSSQVEPDFNDSNGITLDKLQFNRSLTPQHNLRSPPVRRGSRGSGSGRPGSPGGSAATTVAWSLSEATNRVTAVVAVFIVIVTPCILVLLAAGNHSYNHRKNTGFLNIIQNKWYGSRDTSGGKWWGGSGWGGAGGGESVGGVSGGSPGLHSTVLQALYRLDHESRVGFLADSSYIEHAEVLALNVNGTYYIDRYRAISRKRDFESLTISLKMTEIQTVENEYRIVYGSDCFAYDQNSGQTTAGDKDANCLASVMLDVSGAYSREGRNNLIWLTLLSLVLWIFSKVSKLLAFKALGPMEKILKDAKGVRSTLRRQLKQLGDRGVRSSIAVSRTGSINENDGQSKMASLMGTGGSDMNNDVVDQLDGERLLQTVEKMADLLFIGFGDAGVEIVRRHLGFSEKDTVQVFVKGIKVPGAMFGFCDIRDFTSATETLEEDVLMFVNLIGHVVHLNTNASGGFCNKNIGDAFFLVWKEQESTSVNDFLLNPTEGNKGGSQGPAPPTPKYAKSAVEKKRARKKKHQSKKKLALSNSNPITGNVSRNPSVNNDYAIDETKASNPNSPLNVTAGFPISQPAPKLGIRKQRSRSLNQMSLLMDLGVDTNIADVLEKRTPTSAARRSSIQKIKGSPNNESSRISPIPQETISKSPLASSEVKKTDENQVKAFNEKVNIPLIQKVNSRKIGSAWSFDASSDSSSLDLGSNAGIGSSELSRPPGRRSSVGAQSTLSSTSTMFEEPFTISDYDGRALGMSGRADSMDSMSFDGVESIGIGGSMDIVDEESSSALLTSLESGEEMAQDGDSGSSSSLTSVSLPPIEASTSHNTKLKPAAPKIGGLTRGGAPNIMMLDDDEDDGVVEMGELKIVPFAEQQEKQLLNGSGFVGGDLFPSPARNDTTDLLTFSKPIPLIGFEDETKSMLSDVRTYENKGGDNASISSSDLSDDEDDDDDDDDADFDEGCDDEEDDEFNDDDDDFMYIDDEEGPWPLPYASPFETFESPRDPLVPFTLADLALKALSQVAHDIDHLNSQSSGAALAGELIKLNVFQHQQEKDIDEDETVDTRSVGSSPSVTPNRTPRSSVTRGRMAKATDKKQKSFFRSTSAPVNNSGLNGSNNNSEGSISVDSTTSTKKPRGILRHSPTNSSETPPPGSSIPSPAQSDRRGSTGSSGGGNRVGVKVTIQHPVIGARPVPSRRGMGMRRSHSSAVLGSSSNMADGVESGSSSGSNSGNSTSKSGGYTVRRGSGAPTRGIRRVASAVMGSSKDSVHSSGLSRGSGGSGSSSGMNQLGGNTPDRAKKQHSRDRPALSGGSVTPTRPASSSQRRRVASGAKLEGGEKFNDKTSEGVKAMVGAFRGVGKSVHLGYGLHCGWAIEGAVGSPLKIDATYLSPDVNIASRLESLTKTYGCDVLLSEAFHSRLSPPAAACCRFMDRVKVKGSQKPIDIFTYDRWIDLPTSWHHGNENTLKLAKRLSHAVGKNKTQQASTDGSAEAVAAALLNDEDEEGSDDGIEVQEGGHDEDFQAQTRKANNTYVQSGLKRSEWGGSCSQHVALSFLSPVQGSNNGRLGALCFPTEYKRVFEHGIRDYVAGKWNDATWVLETCRALCPADRAPTVVLDFMSSEVAAAKWRMESRGKKGNGLTSLGAPLDWRNSREMDIK